MVQYVSRDSFRDCAGDICPLIVNVQKLPVTSRVFLLEDFSRTRYPSRGR